MIYSICNTTIGVPLTESLCLACRFFDDQDNFITFSDGVWSKDSTVLNDGDFSGNVAVSSNSNTSFLFLKYPAVVVNVGDTLVCSSSTLNQESIITIGNFSK